MLKKLFYKKIKLNLFCNETDSKLTAQNLPAHHNTVILTEKLKRYIVTYMKSSVYVCIIHLVKVPFDGCSYYNMK